MPTQLTEHLPFAKESVEQALTVRLAMVVDHFAEQIALRSATEQLTYRALAHKTNGVAHAVEGCLGVANEPVLLFLPHDTLLIVAMVGTLKANKAYVAIDPGTPLAYLQLLQAQTQARLILTNDAHQAALCELFGATSTVLSLDGVAATACAPTAQPTADSMAGILFTSGSTGQPKGVIRTHRTLLHRTWYESQIEQLGANDRISMLYRASFGASVTDWCIALLNGATLCLFDLQAATLSHLTSWLQTEQITRLHLPLQFYRQWVSTLPADAYFPALREIIPSGRQTRRDYEQMWPHLGPTCCFITRLASTESGLITCGLITRQSALDSEVIPVGLPTPDKSVTLVDEQGQLVAQGESGEIVVQSRYFAAGYWQQPEQTRQKFVPHPQEQGVYCYYTGDIGRWRTDGQLELLGRKDEMVKIRGYRVEIRAVEVALAALPMVKNVAVVVQQPLKPGEQAGEPILVAYWVATTAPAPTTTTLRQVLATTLPDYMIPRHFILLEALPLLPNGKIDLKALPPLATKRPTVSTPFVAPRNAVETQLAAIWEEILTVQPIGIQDHFFELGGHSIAVLRLLHQIEQQFQQPVALRAFIFQPTIAHLATLLAKPQTPDGVASEIGAAPNLREFAVTEEAEHTVANQAELRFLYEALADKSEIRQVRNKLRPKPVLPRRLQLLLRFPQPVALSLLYRLLQQPWVQQRYLPNQRALIKRFVGGLEPPSALKNLSSDNLVARCLFFGALSHFNLRGTIFSRIAKGAIPVEGLAMLETAHAQQQGVILLSSHRYQAPYFRSLQLTRSVIGDMELLIKNVKFDQRMAEQILYARQLELARQTLQQGGVISIAPDVSRGHGTAITMPFHGRMHPFRTSFADLALLTNAQIFFVASDLQAYNRFSFQLVGPFDMGTSAMGYAERVQHLMKQYAAHLRQQWARNPWALPWWLMSEHLACPPIFA
jgi:amino acid adenylation domain-containing protein